MLHMYTMHCGSHCAILLLSSVLAQQCTAFKYVFCRIGESSEPEIEDCEEIWDEEEGQVIEELQLIRDVGAPSPVTDSQLQSTSLQSRALSQWF